MLETETRTNEVNKLTLFKKAYTSLLLTPNRKNFEYCLESLYLNLNMFPATELILQDKKKANCKMKKHLHSEDAN